MVVILSFLAFVIIQPNMFDVSYCLFWNNLKLKRVILEQLCKPVNKSSLHNFPFPPFSQLLVAAPAVSVRRTQRRHDAFVLVSLCQTISNVITCFV